MTQVSTNSCYVIPPRRTALSAPANGSITIDANDEAVGFVFMSPITGSCTKLGFFTNTVTAGGDLLYEMQAIDTSTGLPNGTLAANNSANITFLSTDDNTWKEGTLTTAASLVRGQYYAVTVTRVSGAFNGQISTFNDSTYGLPYNVSKTTSWGTANGRPKFTLYVDGQYIDVAGNFPFTTVGTVNATSGVWIGNKYTPNSDQVFQGFRVNVDIDNNCEFVLFDTDGTTPIASVDGYTNVPPVPGGTDVLLYSDNNPTLTAGQTYYIACLTSSSNNAISYFSSPNADVRASASGGGFLVRTVSSDTTPSGTGDWTDTDTDFLDFGPIVASVVEEAGGGGGGASAHAYVF